MKKILMFLTVTVFVTTSAFAVINPDDNVMGLYWDQNADIYGMEAVTYPVNLYVILTNPTMETLGGFEFAFTIEGSILPYLLSAVLINPNACDLASGFQNFIVGLGSPHPTSEATILATISVLNYSGVALLFYLHESSPASIEGDLPVIVSESALRQITVNGLPGQITACMGYEHCGGLPTEGSTWDKVKTMYR